MFLKLPEKNPVTKSNIWEATVLQVGHKSFIEKLAMDVSMQIKTAIETPFVPSVREIDPDLTIYDNVNHILLNEQPGSQARKRLQLGSSQQQFSSQQMGNDVATSLLNDIQPEQQLIIDEAAENQLEIDNCEVLNPDDVSRTPSELESPAAGLKELNCSGIGNNAEDAEHKPVQGSSRSNMKAMSSTPGNSKKLKKRKAYGPEEIRDVQAKNTEIEASRAITKAADKMMDAADKIVNCVTELRSDLRTEFKPAVTALGNRNYREVQMTTNAVKQLVIIVLDLIASD